MTRTGSWAMGDRFVFPARVCRVGAWSCVLGWMLTVGSAPASPGGFDKAVDTLRPRVVKLYGLGVGPQSGYGSGILVSPDGMVLTVSSLLIDSETIRAVTSDGTMFGAEVVHRDAELQMALLRLKPLKGEAIERRFEYFEVACPGSGGSPGVSGDGGANCLDFLKPGDWVAAAGNAFKVADGMEAVSVFRGVYSARTRMDARRKVKDFPYRGDVLVIDAITSTPGAPGGAVVDIEGRLVGMVGREVISNLTHTHFNHAIPRDVLWSFLQSAANPNLGAAAGRSRVGRETDRSEQLDVGIRVGRTGYRDLPPFVERVRPGSPAERAGVRKDDLILSVNASNVNDVRAFDERWSRLRAGEAIDLVLRRDRRILTVRIEPENPP